MITDPHAAGSDGAASTPRTDGTRPADPTGGAPGLPELLTMGRVGVDLYPLQANTALEDVATFAKSVGGSPTNVAVGGARLGHRAAVITKVGDDAFGRYVLRALAEFGVDTTWIGTDPNLRTPLAFCELFPPDHFPLLFYRQPSAPDLQLRSEDLDRALVRGARLLWTTGSALSTEPSRDATLEAMAMRPPGSLTVLDLDYRPTFWADPADATNQIRAALEHATVAVGNLEEAQVAVGVDDPGRAADALLEAGVDVAVVKLGPRGVVARSRAEPEREVAVRALPVEVTNGLGAGDAFGAGLCHGLLCDWDLERTIRFASAAGAYVAQRLACADAMPRATDVEELMLAHA